MEPSPVEPLRIRVEPSMHDPDTCKFVASRALHDGAPLFYETSDTALPSPLAVRLFAIEGVSRVLIDGSVLSVTKQDIADWQAIARHVGSALRAHVASGEPVVIRTESPNPLEANDGTDAALALAITHVLDTEINPRVQGHGGKILLGSVKEGVAYVSMAGGCQGCGAAKLTLTFSVEAAIRKAVPGIVRIVDTTDHQAGKAPFYESNATPHG